MATCTKCGDWAGIGRSEHDYDCTADARDKGHSLQPRSETEALVMALRPVLMKAATRAGLVGAFTLIAAAILASILHALLS